MSKILFSDLLASAKQQQAKLYLDHNTIIQEAEHHFLDRNDLDYEQPVAPVAPVPTIRLSPPTPAVPSADLITNAISHAQREYPDITLDPSQHAALTMLLQQKYACLIGPAGTGKTTTMKFFLAALSSLPQFLHNLPIVRTMSFMGRATQQIKNHLPPEYRSLCKTIHLHLEYKPEDQEYTDPEDGLTKTRRIFKPIRTYLNQLDATDIIIIDEAGTVPVDLFNNLIEATPSSCRIILLGDIQQIPPAFGHAVLPYAMLKWPTRELTEIHRQALDNPIIANAHNVLNGQPPIMSAPKFFMVTLPDAELQASHAVLRVVKRMQEQGAFDPTQDIVITPQNVSELGQIRLNEMLVTNFNPPNNPDPALCTNPRIFIDCIREQRQFAVGDKVMLTANDTKRGLTNGMLGTIVHISLNGLYRPHNIGRAIIATKANVRIDASDTSEILSSIDQNHNDHQALTDTEQEKAQARASDPTIDHDVDTQLQASHITTIVFNDFPDREYSFNSVGHYSKLQHGYAITCHKAQGGQYRTGVIVCHACNNRMLSREWLYTAITRAEDKVVILFNDYNHKGLSTAVSRQRLSGNSIEEKAQKFLEIYNKAGKGEEVSLLPVLHEPRHLEINHVPSVENS